MSLLACNAFVAFSPAQANCLTLDQINLSQLVFSVNDLCTLCYINTAFINHPR